MPTPPRVLHLNDCAFVGSNLVRAAARQGETWRYQNAMDLTPGLRPGSRKWSPLEIGRVAANWLRHVRWAEVVHVHFATTAQGFRLPLVPARPHALHLHGTDIRELWPSADRHREIQGYIDRAAHVFYSTPDIAENATSARPDAEYMPIFFDPEAIRPWTPRPVVLFPSRWDNAKGAETTIALAKRLREADPTIQMEGLAWGEHSEEARAAGIVLRPRMSHREYLAWMATGAVAVGQSGTVLGVSELEAIATGLPLVSVGHHLPGPDGRPLPILEGTAEDTTDMVLHALADPAQASTDLGGVAWARRHHLADAYIPRLQRLYREIAGRPGDA